MSRNEDSFSIPTGSVQDGFGQELLPELALVLEALQIRDPMPRLEAVRVIRSIQLDIRRFNQMVSVEVITKRIPNQSSTGTGELDKGKLEIGESEDTYTVQDLVDKVARIQRQVDRLEKQHKKMLAEEYMETLARRDLPDIQRYRVLMSNVMERMRNFQNQKLQISGVQETAAVAPLTSLPDLPPLVLSDITHAHIPRSENSESDDESSSNCSSEIEETENVYSFDDPYWTAFSAHTSGLASEEEEHEMMLAASSLLGSNQKAKNMIALFDESGLSINAAGDPVGTSREFLRNIPLLYMCNEKKGLDCSICKTGFPSKDHCAHLPCQHFFHVKCILEWLLRKNTCPLCRRQFPRR